MLSNLKKLNDHVKKGNLKQIGLTILVQLLIDSLVELLQVVLRQINAVESKQETEAQRAFLAGLRGNIVAFQNLKKQLENLSDSDGIGELFAQPKSGELFATKPKNAEDSLFVKQLLEEQKKEFRENRTDSELGL